MKAGWATTGVTIASNGWTDAVGRSIIIVVALGGDAPVLLDVINADLEKKNATWIAGVLCKAIEEVGSDNVIQVCMDNASANRSAATQVTTKYPRIVTTNCAAHCINLLFKDICSITVFSEVLAMVNTIVVFLHRPTRIRRTWMVKYSKLEALKPGATRFGSQYIMLKRYLEIEDNLRQFMVSDDWINLGLEGKRGIDEMVEWVTNRDNKQCALEVLRLLEPCYEVLRYVDTRVYTAGDLYTDLYNLKQQLERACEGMSYILKPDKAHMTVEQARTLRTAQVMQALKGRWESVVRNDLHGSAYLLHPCTPASKWEDPQLRQGFMDLVNKWWPAEAGAQHSRLLQLEMFERSELEFSKEAAQWAKQELLAKRKMTPALWWRMYGRHVGGLADMAVKILSQPITSSDCERCFSLFGAVQRKNRRRLASQKMASSVRVSFAKNSLQWAEDQAAKRNKAVTQCAMQSSEDAAADSLTQTALLSAAGSSSQHSEHSAVATEGSTSNKGERALDLLLGPSFDHMSFIRSEFIRASVQLPVVSTIINDVDIIPEESLDWSSDDDAEGDDDEECDMHVGSADAAHDSDPDMDYDPRVG